MKLAKWIVNMRIPIFILSFLLLIPSIIGYNATRVNYDVRVYLPKSIETMKGQDILEDQFGTGAYSMVVCEGLKPKQVAALEKEIKKVDHVSNVIWYDSILDTSVPMDLLPKKVYDAFNQGDATLMFVTFDSTSSSDETMQAVSDIRPISDNLYLSGAAPMVLDTKNLADQEVYIYVAIAVALALVILMLTMNNFLVPLIFLTTIGIAIVYNLGSNIMFGEISYITKAIAAVLQLGTTLDYSIFLWNSYNEYIGRYGADHNRAMAHAIKATFQSVTGSSITTIAGFIALCFMSFTLGRDMGLVMAKGVLIGVIGSVTILPSFILIFDKLLAKTNHKPLLPTMKRISQAIVKHHVVFAIVMVALLIPFAYFQSHTQVYYNLDSSLPADLPSSIANQKLNDDFHIGATHMLLIDKDTPEKDIYKMIDEMEDVDGVDAVLGIESVVGPAIPRSVIPSAITDQLENDNYRLMVVLNKYKGASDEVNKQIDELNAIVKNYDPTGMVVGEAPLTKDLITITNHDFGVVDSISIGLVFLIIVLVFKSASLPIILVAVIETAIFINLGIPYFTGTKLPFIANIVVSTIQLGSTVDYAILMTSRYQKERCNGKSKQEAIGIAHSTSMNSILISGLSFFGATFGVGLYSNIDMISSLCTLMARGAIISMFMVLLCLPSLIWIFDGLIVRTTAALRKTVLHKDQNKKEAANANA